MGFISQSTEPVEPTEKSAAAQPSKDALRLWLKLLRVTRCIVADVRERLRVEFNTTLPRFDAMAALARCETGLSMTALSRFLVVLNGNVTGLIERMVSDGLVVRTSDPLDRRSNIVRLTKVGSEAFGHMASAIKRGSLECLVSIRKRKKTR